MVQVHTFCINTFEEDGKCIHELDNAQIREVEVDLTDKYWREKILYIAGQTINELEKVAEVK